MDVMMDVLTSWHFMCVYIVCFYCPCYITEIDIIIVSFAIVQIYVGQGIEAFNTAQLCFF